MPAFEDDPKIAAVLLQCPNASRNAVSECLKAAAGDVARAVQLLSKKLSQGGGIVKASQLTGRSGKPEEYFVGGGDSSGVVMMVKPTAEDDENSNKKTDVENFIKSICDRIREEGAEIRDYEQVLRGARARDVSATACDRADCGGYCIVPFSGEGHRVGHTEGSTSYAIKPVSRNIRTVVLQMYKNGFRIDDGELRPFEGKNKNLLETLSREHYSSEISAMYPNDDIDVRLENYALTEYTVPAYRAFSGVGHTLNTNSIVIVDANERELNQRGNNNIIFDGSHSEAEQTVPLLPGGFSLIPGAPTVSIVFRTPNGQYTRKFNPENHTLNDIQYVAHELMPHVLINRLTLSVRTAKGFRRLTEWGATIAQLDIGRSVIMLEEK